MALRRACCWRGEKLPSLENRDVAFSVVALSAMERSGRLCCRFSTLTRVWFQFQISERSAVIRFLAIMRSGASPSSTATAVLSLTLLSLTLASTSHAHAVTCGVEPPAHGARMPAAAAPPPPSSCSSCVTGLSLTLSECLGMRISSAQRHG